VITNRHYAVFICVSLLIAMLVYMRTLCVLLRSCKWIVLGRVLFNSKCRMDPSYRG